MRSLAFLALLTACSGGDFAVAHKSTTAAFGGGYSPAPTTTAMAEPAPPSHASIVEPRPQAEPERPGLGTTFGESLCAPVSFAPFQRSSSAPWAEVVLHYNDLAGISAHAAYLGAQPAPLEVPAGDGSLSVALVDDAGRTLPGLASSGRLLVVGED